MTPGEWPSVSVIVPMFNEEGNIERCVRSLQEQDYPAERLEIVVVDGLSTDRSVDVVRRVAANRPAPVVTLRSNPKRSTASGLNAGIASASGSVIVRLDAHAEAPPDYVRRNVAILLESGADYVGGRPENRSSGYWGTAIAAAMGSAFGVGAPFRHATEAGDVDTVAFGAFRRETFDRMGPFDESLPYSEDNEYTYRIRSAGGRVRFDPSIWTIYRTRESLGALARQYFRYGRGRMRHALRDRGGVSLRHAAPMALVTALGLAALAVPWSRAARAGLATIAAVWAIGATAAAVRTAARSGWRLLPALPVVFAVLHASYGAGQWRAVGDLWTGERPDAGGTS